MTVTNLNRTQGMGGIEAAVNEQLSLLGQQVESILAILNQGSGGDVIYKDPETGAWEPTSPNNLALDSRYVRNYVVGLSENCGTLQQAVSFLNALGTPVILELPSGNHNIVGVNLHALSNIEVYPLPGANVIPNTHTCTIDCLSRATGNYQWITRNNTGNVVFGPGAVDRVVPQWWGAKGDFDIDTGIGTDDYLALQDAADSLYPWGGKYYLPTSLGAYYTTQPVRLRPKTEFYGELLGTVLYGKGSTFVPYGDDEASGWNYTYALVRIPAGEYTGDPVADDVHIHHIKFMSDGDADHYSTQMAYYLLGPGGIISRCNNVTVDHCIFEGFYREALDAYGTARRNVHFRNNYFYNNNHDALCFNGPHGGSITDNFVYKCNNGVEASGGAEGDAGGIPYYDIGGLIVSRNHVIGAKEFGIRVPSILGTTRMATSGVLVSQNIVLGDRVLERYPIAGIKITCLANGVIVDDNFICWANQVGIWSEPGVADSNNERVKITNNIVYDVVNPAAVVWGSGIFLSQGGGGKGFHHILTGNIIYCTDYTIWKMLYGVLINPSMQGPLTLTGNQIQGPRYSGIYAQSCFIQNWKVESNFVEDPGWCAIVLANSTGSGLGVTVSGNTSRGNKGTQTGVYPLCDFYISGLKWAQVVGNESVECAAPGDYPWVLILNNCEDTEENGNKGGGNTGVFPAVYLTGTTKGTYRSMAQGCRKLADVNAAPTSGRWMRGCHGMNCEPAGGEAAGWSCISPTEAQGWGDQAGTSTTGDITATEYTLTVASATGWQPGDAISVAGAGAGGATLTTRVRSIAGLVFTLVAAAGTTVDDAACTHVTPVWKAQAALAA